MIKNIDDIIEFENENTEVDFKAIQYQKVKFHDLLKDLISMANAKTNNDKYIIVGVKLQGNGTRDILGVKEDFIDEASYQQLVHNNIEPELNFSYSSYQFQNITLGVFKVFDCINPPYMMKKDFGKLKVGEAFIRKGSHQTRLTRKDIDFYIEEKISEKKFKGKIHTYFEKLNQKTIELSILTNVNYPSDKAAEKINKILLEKKKKLKNTKGKFSIISHDIPFLGGTSYENRSIRTLEENLENVAETYQEDDFHYLFETNAHKFNFRILNDDIEYLEDVSLELKIEKDGIYIANKIFPESYNSNSLLYLNYIPSPPSWESLNYTEITENETEYVIFEDLGNLKHQISDNALKVDLRIAISPTILNNEKIVKIKIFGKNLSTPIEDQLIIKVVE